MKRQLDIGAGGAWRKHEGYEYIGIDAIVNEGSPIIKCSAGFEKLPFDDEIFDLVTAYDVLEHIPFQIIQIVEEGKAPVVYRPAIYLFDEIWRVLKPDGVFFSSTPFFPHREIFQDPTHVAFWTDETANYFSGDYYGFHDVYKHTSCFEKVSQNIIENIGHIELTLRAIKPSTFN